MNGAADDIWTGRSVLLKSFWGWTPDTWAALGWSNPGRRQTMCEQLTNPFIHVCSVTLNAPVAEPHELGQIMGFYLVSHEAGDRDEFTHPVHHSLEPTRWRYSLRAVSAFEFLPEYRLSIREFDASLMIRAQPMGSQGEIIKDSRRLALLREIPWIEVPVYQSGIHGAAAPALSPSPAGLVRAGPENAGGYFVPAITQGLPRHLYILRLDGPADAFLGVPANRCHIVKIGLAASPELRRSDFQRALPRCAFTWRVHRTSHLPGVASGWTFRAAESGEYAMKRYLAANAKHLDGEFYLASDSQIEEAWRLGNAAAQAFGKEAS